MPERFEQRMAVSWTDDAGFARYGVVMSSGGVLEIAEVRAADPSIKCYTDSGAIRREAEHNVRITEYPPFSLLRISSEAKSCYALANPQHRFYFSEDDILDTRMYAIDDGAKICDFDFNAILDHPWRDEKERERSPREIAEAFAAAQRPDAQVQEQPKRRLPSSFESLMAAVNASDREDAMPSDDFQFGG